MKIDRTTNYVNNRTAFTALDTKKAQNLLFSRLSTYNRYQSYDNLRRALEELPFTVELSTSKNGRRLQGRVVHPDSTIKQESLISSLFKLSPVPFIKKLVAEGKNLQNAF